MDKKVGQNIAIVMPGGGMRCAYSAGAVVALAKEFGFYEPSMFFASSGSVGTMFYFLARQYDAVERIWTRHLATCRFVSLLRPWKIMDIDWLVDEVFRRIDPLDTRAVFGSRTEWSVPLTDKKSGDVRFISKKDGLDVFEIMRAAKAVPFVYGKPVVLDGREYVDGDITKPLDLVSTLLPARISKVILLETRAVAQMEKESVGRGRVFIHISPNKTRLARLSVNRTRLARAFESGYEDCANNPVLRGTFD